VPFDHQRLAGTQKAVVGIPVAHLRVEPKGAKACGQSQDLPFGESCYSSDQVDTRMHVFWQFRRAWVEKGVQDDGPLFNVGATKRLEEASSRLY